MKKWLIVLMISLVMVLIDIGAAVAGEVIFRPRVGIVIDRAPAVFYDKVVKYAEQWIGVTPYVFWYNRMQGNEIKNSLEAGTDCSGFVSLIYQHFDVQLPVDSASYQILSNVDYENIIPGDIIVYRYGGHVGIYAGEDMIIHCSNPEKGTVKQEMWFDNPTGYVHAQRGE